MADNSTQYHVTVRSPVSLKLGGSPVLVRCFDATIVGVTGEVSINEFRIVRVWQVRPDGSLQSHKITQTLSVPVDNIAGLVAQPFEK